jgi:hypothetical protein
MVSQRQVRGLEIISRTIMEAKLEAFFQVFALLADKVIPLRD